MPKPVRIYLSIGSNIPSRVGFLRSGLRKLQASGVKLDRVSSLYRTSPVGFTRQAHFLNAAVSGLTTLSPEDLLGVLQKIEKGEGRARGRRFGPRTLDLDLLLYGNMKSRSRDLILPHPRMTQRKFVLVPLLEISPGLWSPDGIPYSRYLSRLPASQVIRRFRRIWFPGSGKK